MADRTFTVDVVTPDRVVLKDTAVSLTAPGVEGSFGILANHAPLLSALKTGELRYRREEGVEVRLAVSGGFLQVSENQVTILADTAEKAGEIDASRARAALNRARDALRDAQEMNRALAQQELERAQNRLKIAGG